MRAREAGPLEALLHERTTSFRRRLIAGGGLALIVLVAISVGLAWRQYDDAKSRAMTDLEARVVGVSAIIDTSFAGQIGMLNAIAEAPSVVGQQRSRMNAYFARIDPKKKSSFSGGLGWLDRKGKVGASSTPGSSGANLSKRLYFQRVVATNKPYVSAGLIGRRLKQPIVVVAVPTHDEQGRVSGVLAGSIVLKIVAESRQAQELGYGNLEIVDRNGQQLLAELRRVENTGLLQTISREKSGVLEDVTGLDDGKHHVVAYAMSSVPGWLTVIDRPRSSVFAAALRALVLELVSVAVAALGVLLVLLFVIRSSRRQREIEDQRAGAWSGLTRALGSAGGPSEIADALRSSLTGAFPDAMVLVDLDDDQTRRVGGSVRHRKPLELPAPDDLVRLARDSTGGTSQRAPGAGRTGPRLHSTPVHDTHGSTIGVIGLLTGRRRLAGSEWALLESFADQAAHALERARLFAHEHQLAARLQESLLPGTLPSANGVDLDGHYQAGGDGVEVGGDWYDAVRRPDGIVQLCIGDVSGRGIEAAVMMGRQRTTFHAYASDLVSPREIVQRMLRRIDGDDMVTLACISLDPYTSELTYSCAGHPPPLLADAATGDVIRLDQASAPPLGFAEAVDIVEARACVPDHAVLALYTDGLIERRGEDLNRGIDLLSRSLVSDAAVSPDRIVADVSEAIGAPDDDVALLLLSFDSARVSFDVVAAAEPSVLPQIRRRLRAWLAHRGVDASEAADLVLAASEACNNAIEHAYPDREGTIRLLVEEEDDVLRVVVEDRGTWRDGPARENRGRGIPLMKQLMHFAQHETGRTGTRVTLERLRQRERKPA
jgi:anti-sigma regulatory factor (Ser/Thr protein kinase)